jgi:hypothetical protein
MLLRNFACYNIKCKLSPARQGHFHLGSTSKFNAYSEVIFHILRLNHSFFGVGAVKCAFNFPALWNVGIGIFINYYIGHHVAEIVPAFVSTLYC